MVFVSATSSFSWHHWIWPEVLCMQCKKRKNILTEYFFKWGRTLGQFQVQVPPRPPLSPFHHWSILGNFKNNAYIFFSKCFQVCLVGLEVTGCQRKWGGGVPSLLWTIKVFWELTGYTVNLIVSDLIYGRRRNTENIGTHCWRFGAAYRLEISTKRQPFLDWSWKMIQRLQENSVKLAKSI